MPLAVKPHHIKSRLNRADKGFTFIEVIVSLALMAIIASIFGMGLVAAMEGYDFSRANTQVSQKSQLAMTRVMRELSELTNVIQTEPYIIYERVKQDKAETVTGRFAIQFDSDNRSLLLHTTDTDTGNTSVNILVDNVADFQLQYYQGADPGWNPGLPLSLLSTIQITLALNRPDGAGTTQFNTLVHLRNTDNLGGAAQ